MKCRMSEEQRKQSLCVYEDEQGECENNFARYKKSQEDCKYMLTPEMKFISVCPFCGMSILNHAGNDIECEHCGIRYRVELI